MAPESMLPDHQISFRNLAELSYSGFSHHILQEKIVLYAFVIFTLHCGACFNSQPYKISMKVLHTFSKCLLFDTKSLKSVVKSIIPLGKTGLVC